MSKKLKEEPLVETLNERYVRFLKSRKGDGRTYVEEIVRFLTEQRHKDPDGWVRAHKLKEKRICVDQTLFRLLAALTDMLVLERRGEKSNDPHRKGQHPVFYRISKLAMITILTDAGRKKEFSRLSDENQKMTVDLMAARTVLYRHKLMDEYAKEIENFWKLPED
jgi:hypothetical protein